ncbi:hypothetical protein LguiA_015229 [Lonicera macranthoides]
MDKGSLMPLSKLVRGEPGSNGICDEMSLNSVSSSGESCSYVTCFCGEPAPIRVSWTSRNSGRRFFGCRSYSNNGCNFFDWVDKEKTIQEEMKEIYNQIRHVAIQKKIGEQLLKGLKT